MLTAHVLRDGFIDSSIITAPDQLPQQAVWLDLIDPSADERRWIQEIFGQPLPTQEAVAEIEVSSRFFQDANGLHIRSFFLYDYPDHPHNVTVAFILNAGRLFTFREEKLTTFHVFKLKARTTPNLVSDAVSIMLRLFETKVDALADLLEELHAEAEEIGQQVIGAKETDLEEVLSRIGASQDTNDKLRLSLIDKQRVLSFLSRSGDFSDRRVPLLREILRDVDSLIAHSMFLFQKADSLTNAVMGRINIEQNKIIKIFSIAAVVFLPPTLIASIYGMNFHFMPELHWPWGYPLVVLIMVLSGIAPYWLFKRKGWL